jgi:hypothetical protein
VAKVSGEHPDLGPELRQLAQTILDRLDPALRIAAARAAASGAGASKCQQVWCPVCALAALASGEQHPLLTVVADHSVALLGVVRALIENAENAGQPAGTGQSVDTPPPPDGAPPPEPPNGDSPPPPGPGRYQHIPVTVEE